MGGGGGVSERPENNKYITELNKNGQLSNSMGLYYIFVLCFVFCVCFCLFVFVCFEIFFNGL